MDLAIIPNEQFDFLVLLRANVEEQKANTYAFPDKAFGIYCSPKHLSGNEGIETLNTY